MDRMDKYNKSNPKILTTGSSRNSPFSSRPGSPHRAESVLSFFREGQSVSSNAPSRVLSIDTNSCEYGYPATQE